MLLPMFIGNDNDEDDTTSETCEVQVGLDEVGRGCLAGPVCAAAVVLDMKQVRHFEELGDKRLHMIKDSKKITKKQRDALVAFIREISLASATSMVDNHEVDRLNILQATMKAMHLATDQVVAKLKDNGKKIDRILVDGTYFKPYLNRDYLQTNTEEQHNERYMYIPHQTVINGDNIYMSIAAASILAKTTRDDYMATICDGRYDWKSNKGYGTPKHLKGLHEFGPSIYHRRTFKYPKPKTSLPPNF
jgi:ribonuclease HII